jgi:hypothetical protein
MTTIGKLDAARRELESAIRLWFESGDPVTIHTLACAAHEVIHTISLKRNPSRRRLLLDAGLANDVLRKPANFFKHADRDGDSVITFDSADSDPFILYSTIGVLLCGEQANVAETAYLMWTFIKRPDLLTDRGRQVVAENLPLDSVECARTLSKQEFFRAVQDAMRRT